MNFKEKFLRKERSWTDILLLVFIQAYLWMQLGGLLSMKVLQAGNWGQMFTRDAAVATDMGTYFCSFGFWISMILALLVFKKNRALLKSLRPEKKTDILKGSGIGLFAGFALNAAIIAGAVATGSLSFSGGSLQVLPIIGYFLAILFQAGGEELICRMFIMGKLKRRYKSPAVAIVGNSLFFLIFHLGNSGINFASILGVFMAGIFFSLVAHYSENLWAAMAMHTAWNFTQTILFGLPNSGEVSPFSIFHAEQAGSGFFYDTGFGVEGSWAAVIIMSLAIFAIIFLFRSFSRETSSGASQSMGDQST